MRFREMLMQMKEAIIRLKGKKNKTDLPERAETLQVAESTI